MTKDLDKHRPPENSKPPLFTHSVSSRFSSEDMMAFSVSKLQ
ncbi:hypothetical protein [Algibacter sp. PT7-4]